MRLEYRWGVNRNFDSEAFDMMDIDWRARMRHRRSVWDVAVLDKMVSMCDMSLVYCSILRMEDCMTFMDDDDDGEE